MMEATIGHNQGPDLEALPRIKRKWAKAIFDHPDKPSGAVALAFRMFFEMDPRGQGIVLTDQELAASCGVTDRAVRTFKKWLLDNGFVIVLTKGARGRGTEFQAQIPEHNSGSSEKYRNTIPEVAAKLPERPSGNRGIAERPSGNQRVPYKESPKGDTLNIYGEQSKKHGGPPDYLRRAPHMNGKGFVISAEHNLFIPTEIVNEWREKFLYIPDLESELTGLSTFLLGKGPMHHGWLCPEGWMVGCLAKTNQKYKNENDVAAMRKQRVSGKKSNADEMAALKAIGRRP